MSFKKTILSHSYFYNLLQRLIIKDFNKCFYAPFIRAKSRDIILDIGCGPANIVQYLPSDSVYYGYDLSEEYIKSAQKKYYNRNAVFKAEAVSSTTLPECLIGKCDLVTAIGVIHHLSDTETAKLISLAKIALRPGGRFVSLDNYLKDGQNFVAQFVIKKDRGEHIRDIEVFKSLVTKEFGTPVSITDDHNFLRIPYNHVIVEWVKP